MENLTITPEMAARELATLLKNIAERAGVAWTPADDEQAAVVVSALIGALVHEMYLGMLQGFGPSPDAAPKAPDVPATPAAS